MEQTDFLIQFFLIHQQMGVTLLSHHLATSLEIRFLIHKTVFERS